MCNNSETINKGQYVIFQRKDYKKLHLLSENTSSVFMGKDKVDIEDIYGKKMGSVFKMIPKKGFNRTFLLTLCSSIDITSSNESFKDVGSGFDNRSIFDDGSSQLLTSHSIEELRDSGTTPKAIIEHLVENSKTFQIKTGFSQEKYIRKKEKKYFEFISVVQPTIRLLAEVLYNRDSPKSIGIRIDTLSQLPLLLNLQPDGNYLLVENGFSGIVAATLLNSLSDEGNLVHITPGNQNQKQAVLAMNFSSSRISQLTTIRLSTMTEIIERTTLASKDEVSSDTTEHVQCISNCETNSSDVSQVSLKVVSPNCEGSDDSLVNVRKRKHSIEESNGSELVLKKPRWEVEAELAVKILQKKVDGLMIACKEFPSNILDKVLTFLLPSRPFVIYSLYQEPLVTLYRQLKQRHDIVYLRITETWLRPYQILSDRTHPVVTMNSSSGFLLSGIKVVNR